MSASARRLRLWLIAATLLAGGCTIDRQCTIPDAPLPPPPGPPLPARVGVAYLDDMPGDSLDLEAARSTFRFPIGPAAVSAVNRAAPQLFEGVVPAERGVPAEGDPEGVLSFRLDSVELRPGPFKAEAAKVKLTAVLRDRRREVARTTVTREAEGQPVHVWGLLHCDSAGAAIGAATSAAVARARDDLGASPAVATWVRDPAREARPTGAPAPPLPAVAQPPAGETWFRDRALPRYLELDAVHGTGWSGDAALDGLAGWGWGVRIGWDLGEYLALGLHAASTGVTVGWTPDPSQPTGRAENGFIGVELMVRLRPGQRVRPWFGLTGAWQGVTWSSYAYSVDGPSLLGSAGVDLVTGPAGALRLGLTYSAYSGGSGDGSTASGTPPGPGAAGSVSMRNLYLTAGWLFDLGPAR